MADSELGELRRPPRAVEDRLMRMAGFRRSGMAGGTSDTPYPVGGSSDGLTVDDSDGGSEDSLAAEWYSEHFTLTAASSSAVSLTNVPIDASEVLALNGVHLVRGVDYTIVENVVYLDTDRPPTLGIGDDAWTLSAVYPFLDGAATWTAPPVSAWVLNGDAFLDDGNVWLTDTGLSQSSSAICPLPVPSTWESISFKATIDLPTIFADGFTITLLDDTEFATSYVGDGGDSQGLLNGSGPHSFSSWMTYSVYVWAPDARFVWDDGTTQSHYDTGITLDAGVHDYRVIWTRTATNEADVEVYIDDVLESATAAVWVPETILLALTAATGAVGNEHIVQSTDIEVTLSSAPLPASPGTDAPPSPGGGGSDPGPTGMTLVLDEPFTGSLNTSIWDVETGTYGAPMRVQYYRPANVVVSAATSGGSGDSLKLISKREVYGGRDFTAGMISTRDLGVYYPVFGRYEAKMKIPHGQGIWPAFWLRHRDGSSTCEVDIMEYFHAEEPGKARFTLHRKNNAGTYQSNVARHSEFFEAPTLTPGWHVFAVDMLPEGDDVRFIGYLDGVEVWNYLDTQAAYWSGTRGTAHPSGGGGENIFDICLQGSQIGGDWVGHPDDPAGYSRGLGRCISESSPGVCRTSIGGYSIWTDANQGGALFPNTFELDYVKVWSAL